MDGDVAFAVHPEVAQSPARHVVELLGVLGGPAWRCNGCGYRGLLRRAKGQF
jgi:hypothetical protein